MRTTSIPTQAVSSAAAAAAREPSAADGVVPRQRSHRESLATRWRRVARSWQLYVLLLPTLVYFAVFKYWPMYGVQIAFRRYNPADGFFGSPWVGLQNFERFFNSYQFGEIIGNTIQLAVSNLVVVFPIPIMLALMVSHLSGARFRRFAQTVLFSPTVISTVVVVGIAFVLLSPRSGLINNALTALGGEPIFFMGDPSWFRPVYVASSVWQEAGFSMIIYLAALSGIDPSLHEAATMDGAGTWKRIWHIDLPGILPVVTVLGILAVGNLLNTGFEKALLLQTPLNLESSQIIQTYVYQVGLQKAQFSYSAAIGLFNSALNLVLLVTFNGIARRARQTSVW